MKVNSFLILFFQSYLAVLAAAKRSLSANSLVTCMEKSQISPTYFEVIFNPDDRSLKYTLDLTTSISTNVTADVSIYAYGFLIIHKTVNLCDLGWKQFCPVYPGSLQVESIEYISKEYVNQIPGIAFNVPDIDAIAKIIIKDTNTHQPLSCLQASFSNGKTVNQTGAKWATAVVAGLGLLIASIMSTFGNSNAASHISANSVSLFLYFQSVVVVSMQHVERFPPIASAWAANLAWSMGLIRVTFMQDIFRWYVQSTGGTPTLFFKGTTKQILVQRAYDYLKELHKRASEISLKSNTNLIVLRGMKRVGYNSRIEPTSIVATGFTFFIIIGYLLIALLVIFKSIIDLLARGNKIGPNKFVNFRRSFPTILKGAILRYIYIGFTQLMIFSLWEFTERDSPAMIVLAVLFLLLPLSVIGLAFYKTFQYGRRSVAQYKNPAALLYGDPVVLNKYGFCYTMFHAEKYWFGIVLIGYNLVKAIFVGLCQGSGKASALALFIFDLAYTVFLIYSAPFLNKPTNIINYLISVVTTINSFLFLFFSNLFADLPSTSSIMGWIFFVLNAAFSLILLILIIVFVSLSVLSKNPDARFAPAKDDRFSFQNKHVSEKEKSFNSDGSSIQGASVDERDIGANPELAALGIAAQEHSNDWETQMYKLNNEHEPLGRGDMLTPSIKNEEKFNGDMSSEELQSTEESSLEHRPSQKSTLGSKLKSVTRGLSMRSNKNKAIEEEKAVSPNKSKSQLTRLSDNLETDNRSMPSPSKSQDPSTPITSNWETYNNAEDNIANHNRNQSALSNISMDNGPQHAKGFV